MGGRKNGVACTTARVIEKWLQQKSGSKTKDSSIVGDGRNGEKHETFVVHGTIVDCKSYCCSNGKTPKKSNESEVEYSPPPGIGFSFACCHLPLSHQADGFHISVDSESSKHFVDPKLIRGIETRMLAYTEINPPMEIKAADHNTLFGTARGILLVLVRDTLDVCRTVKLPTIRVPGLGRNIFFTALTAQKGVNTSFTTAGSIVDLGLVSIH